MPAAAAGPEPVPRKAGAPQLAREIGVVLTCDHRVLDGVYGLQLLNGVRERLELPAPLFA